MGWFVPFADLMVRLLCCEVNDMPMHKKFWIKCSTCDEMLERNLEVICKHYKIAHAIDLSEADAYKLASPQKAKKTPYSEGVKRNFNEVSGGLPSLGKRR